MSIFDKNVNLTQYNREDLEILLNYINDKISKHEGKIEKAMEQNIRLSVQKIEKLNKILTNYYNAQQEVISILRELDKQDIKPITDDNDIKPITDDNDIKPITDDNDIKLITDDNDIKPIIDDNDIKPIIDDNDIKQPSEQQTEYKEESIQTEYKEESIQTEYKEESSNNNFALLDQMSKMQNEIINLNLKVDQLTMVIYQMYAMLKRNG